jgi:membrane-associated phospholipid phosphatase
MVAILAVAGFVVDYLVAVRTTAGQAFEDSILQAALRASDSGYAAFTNALLRPLGNVVGFVAIAVVVGMGLAQRRTGLAIAGAAVILASITIVESFQHATTRPVLLPHGYRRGDQSFPSGHVALATSIACALILVVPPLYRRAVAVAVAVPASVVASATIAAGWHRPGDVLGSDLIVLAVTSVAIAVLAATGSLPSGRTRRPPWWLLVLAGLVMVEVVGGLIAAIPAAGTPGHPVDPGVAPAANATFALTQILALAAGFGVVLAVLALLGGIGLRPEARVGERHADRPLDHVAD